MIIDAPSSQNRRISWRSNNSARWALLVNNTTESGGDAGSDLRLFYYNDSGSFSGTALSIERSTGLVQITQGIENTTIGANTPAPATFTKINTGGTVTVAPDDKIPISDTSNSGSLREVTAQSIADLGVVEIAKTEITLTSAQILSLNTTPITLISAPGSGNYIVVHKVVGSIDYNSTPYTSGDLILQYTGGTGCATLPDDLAEATTDEVFYVDGKVDGTGSAGINEAVEIYSFGSDPTTGNSDIKIIVFYSIGSV
jgi:hypothetical protein